MRSICNVVYMVRMQALEDEAEQKVFDHNLALPPGARERVASRGTAALLGLYDSARGR